MYITVHNDEESVLPLHKIAFKALSYEIQKFLMKYTPVEDHYMVRDNGIGCLFVYLKNGTLIKFHYLT